MVSLRRRHWRIAALVAFPLILSLACASRATTPVDYDFAAVCAAVEDMRQRFGDAYQIDAALPSLLRRAAAEQTATVDAARRGDREAAARLSVWRDAAREALLANPLLDFDTLLLVRRSADRLGLPQNWEGNSSLPGSGFDNALVRLSPLDNGEVSEYYRPERDVFAGDVCLHYDGERLLFSMPEARGRWRIYELELKSGIARVLPLINERDVDNYDACYLPDDNIIFTSTAPFVGVPCVTGSSHVSNLYRYDVNSGTIRRLTFEQDHNWSPRVLPNGRILYQRWEYSDIPHFVSRLLFHANPDGTGQMEYYGSNSYWPNAMFYARPVPGHPTQVAVIVSGHHGVPRQGELVILDPALGRHEASGVVRRIPGRDQAVEPIIEDNLVDHVWPRFLHPWPLDSHYLIVSAKPAPDALWGVYLVDAFDNMTLLKELPGQALLEPIPLKSSPRPPVVPDRVHPERDDAVVLMSDVYVGPGLEGVPRGAVKHLRLFTYHFAYHGVGGQVNRIGLDGPWDIKRVLGTVPVEPDGSAHFRVPANTPISIQPLDEQGQALQLMRSWMTAMPGETLSCVGCHEQQNTPPPVHPAQAARRAPSEVIPWYGPTRGFSFRREVQPVLDHYCVTCHNGEEPSLPDFRDLPDVHTAPNDAAYAKGSQFPPAYLALRRYVRTPTMESDMHLLPPLEFRADTTELMQILREPHQNLELGPESWDRIITWIDLNAPAHGTWHEIVGMRRIERQRERRQAMHEAYARGVGDDPEAIYDLTPLQGIPVPEPRAARRVARAARSSVTSDSPMTPVEKRRIDLGSGVALELALIPAGEFVMGENDGYANEAPAHGVLVSEAFWMGVTEVTNAQFARFDADHDSRLEHGDFLQFSVEERGWPLNTLDQPVTRVTWEQAMAFCAWLSEQVGMDCSLPSEAQWEYACRAGTSAPMWYGDTDADFADFENLADSVFSSVETFEPWKLPSGAIHPWRPAVNDVNDGYRVSAPVGVYTANPFGLRDMHGNVAEWTRTAYRAYPYLEDDGRNRPDINSARVVRGGAWSDRPHRARSAMRRAYAPWQQVYNVGFRVACIYPSCQNAETPETK